MTALQQRIDDKIHFYERMKLSKSQEAVIRGWAKMGATIEQVCYYMGIDGVEVERVFSKTEILRNEIKIH